MTVINLTDKYLELADPSFYERLKYRHMRLDFYLASSISEVEDHFQKEPPRKRCTGRKSAYVTLENTEIKRVDDDFEYHGLEKFLIAENNWNMIDFLSMQAYDKDEFYPIFEIKDNTHSRTAVWMAGSSRDYYELQREFGFNRYNSVIIPEIVLQYWYFENRGLLAIKNLVNPKKPKQKKKCLKERILEFIPFLPEFSPQPA